MGVNKKNLLEGLFISEETEIPVLWRDRNFPGSEANYFILG